MTKDTAAVNSGEPVTQTQQSTTPATYCRTIDARRVLEGLAVDPLIGMAELARDPDVDCKTRAKIYMELAQYIYEKKKSAASEETIQMETYEERLRRIRGQDNFTDDTENQPEQEQEDE